MKNGGSGSRRKRYRNLPLFLQQDPAQNLITSAFQAQDIDSGSHRIAAIVVAGPSHFVVAGSAIARGEGFDLLASEVVNSQRKALVLGQGIFDLEISGKGIGLQSRQIQSCNRRYHYGSCPGQGDDLFSGKKRALVS